MFVAADPAARVYEDPNRIHNATICRDCIFAIKYRITWFYCDVCTKVFPCTFPVPKLHEASGLQASSSINYLGVAMASHALFICSSYMEMSSIYVSSSHLQHLQVS